jgi:hypothetical protein
METQFNASKFCGVDTVDYLIDLANQISKVMPDISFKPNNMTNWNINKEIYPDGVCDSFNVYHATDLNNYIGTIEVSNFYYPTVKPKYGMTSINIKEGRHTYGNDGKYKYSIHAKNIVREAKKAFKPFTFDQIADRARRNFRHQVESIGSSMVWDVRNNTSHDIEIFKEDLISLHNMGHKFKSLRVATMVDYLVANKEKIEKYSNYDPDHYFVLVKDNEVQYRLNSLKNADPYKVSNKDALPDEIKGKLFVLDITDKQEFVEDIGLKENDGAYWIIA